MNILNNLFFRNSILVLAGASFLAYPNSAWAKDLPTSQRMVITNDTCEKSFSKIRSAGAEGATDLLISFADTILDEVFSLVDKWLEKRKKDRTATYGSAELLTSGLQESTRCVKLVNGQFGSEGNLKDVIPGLHNSFYTKIGVNDISSFFAVEIESEPLKGVDSKGLGALKITPYHAAFLKTSAKKGDKKDIVLTISMEASHNDPKKGIQKEEVKRAFDMGEMSNNLQKVRDNFRTDSYQEFISEKFLKRPVKISVSVVETEDDSFYEKVVTSFYEDEKDNIKEIIQGIWGTTEED